MSPVDQFRKAYPIVVRATFDAYLSGSMNFQIYAETVIALDFAIQTELEFVEDAT